MSVPAYIQKTLVMKPEVTKIFEDLEKWHDHCRFEMINFDPKDLYRSREYKEWARGHEKKPWNGERKPYLGKNPRYNNGERFSR